MRWRCLRWSVVVEALNKLLLIISLKYAVYTNNSAHKFKQINSVICKQNLNPLCLSNIETYHECKIKHSCNSDDSATEERNHDYYDSDDRSYEVLDDWVIRVPNKVNALLSAPASDKPSSKSSQVTANGLEPTTT